MGGERFPHVATDYLVNAYDDGATLSQLAGQTGMNAQSVAKRIVRAGGSIRPRGAHNKPRGTLEQVWATSFVKGSPDECWLWIGSKLKSGYGRISVGSFRTTAQRYAILRQGIAIPPGHEVDHLCFNPSCVNPGHLEVVTSEENKHRRTIRRTCNRGHSLTPDNVVTERDGEVRRCRICRTQQKARQRSAKKESA